MRLLVLYSRSRSLALCLICGLGLGVLTLALSSVVVTVPFVQESITAPLLYVLPITPAFVSLATLSTSLEGLEELNRFRMVWLRAIHATALLLVTSAGAVFALSEGPWAAQMYARNAIHYAGFLVLTTALMGVETGWMPVVSWAAITFFAGKDPGNALPRWWAVLLQDGVAAWTTAIIVALLGIVAFAWLGPGRVARHS